MKRIVARDKRSLWDCYHAKVGKGEKLFCSQGYPLPHNISIFSVARGAALGPQICQDCLHYEAMEPCPLSKGLRGWDRAVWPKRKG